MNDIAAGPMVQAISNAVLFCRYDTFQVNLDITFIVGKYKTANISLSYFTNFSDVSKYERWKLNLTESTKAQHFYSLCIRIQ